MRTALAILARLSFCLAFVAGGAVASAFAQIDFNANVFSYTSAHINSLEQKGDFYLHCEPVKIVSHDALNYINNDYILGLGNAGKYRNALPNNFTGFHNSVWPQNYLSIENLISESLNVNIRRNDDDYVECISREGYYFIPIIINAGKVLFKVASNSPKFFRKKNKEKEPRKPETQDVLATSVAISGEEKNSSDIANLRKKGEIYYKGKGVLPNYKEAAKWYRLAADQGDALSQYRLGLMYLKGKGFEKDYYNSYIWFALAGVYDTGEIGENAFKHRQFVEDNLTSKQFNQAQAEAAKHLEEIKKKQTTAQ